MCGIFGFASKEPTKDVTRNKKIVKNLYKLSESRGNEASGCIFINEERISYFKDSVPASELIKNQIFNQNLDNLLNENNPVFQFGHARMATNGEADNNDNNQPIRTSGIVGVHNGIITNVDSLWSKHSELNRKLEVDTEIFLQLVRQYMSSDNNWGAIEKAFDEIEGVANVAMAFEDQNVVILATNNGSLYYVKSEDDKSFIFASERYILEQTIMNSKVTDIFKPSNIQQISARSIVEINLENLRSNLMIFDELKQRSLVEHSPKRKIEDMSIQGKETIPASGNSNSNDFSQYYERYEENKSKIAQLRRCTKCILPETMPFIQFDIDGICNYCNHYKRNKVKSLETLKQKVFKTDNQYDCLVTLSGGRDSSYGLHFIKEELGLNPITYTYDWGMVTDLARRNQMRMCGELGVEHVLVSANIQRKRDNIRRNVSAWLKRPELGMVPLFMAGDKQYFYWANVIAVRTGVKKIILCENLLETTKFKTGFCGIAPKHGIDSTYTLSLRNKFQMIYYYGRNFLRNPAYLNKSMLDTMSAFSSYYVMDHEYINLFEYVKWDENVIVNTLLDGYKWETSPDTQSTWRIGDGTAPFYNYIYYTMAGLTENDTFRSNQIREGQITRKEALRLSKQENEPRFDSIVWYLDTIGLGFEETINVINGANKLYKM